jgi:predicted transglutaminase-like cysteine proteinase
MHHLINELRPHQARESIRCSLQSQKRQRFETTARLNKQIERVNDIINSAINSITDYNINDLSLQSIIENNSNKCENNENAIVSVNNNFDNNYELDALMCNFVDEI